MHSGRGRGLDADEDARHDAVAAGQVEGEGVGDLGAGTPLELVAQEGPRPVEAGLHQVLADAEGRRGVRGIEPLDVAQDELRPDFR